jgi:cell wall-associated NlpC family hydrolase
MFAIDAHLRRNALAAALAMAFVLPHCASAQSSARDNTLARSASKGAAPSANDTLARTAKAAATTAWNGAQDVAIYALGLIGVDYRFGGETPEGGVDCSGLVRYVFQQVTGVTLPRTSQELSRLGNKVASTDLAPGDLVFFNTRKFPFSHVGIYLGDNRFIHAPSTGSEVEISQLSETYWQKHFNGARRLVGVLPSLFPTAVAATLAPPNAAVKSPDAPVDEARRPLVGSGDATHAPAPIPDVP